MRRVVLCVLFLGFFVYPCCAEEMEYVPLSKLIEARTHRTFNRHPDEDVISIRKDLFDFYTKRPKCEIYCVDSNCSKKGIRYIQEKL